MRPDNHSSIRASTAISRAQGAAKHDAGEQCPVWAKRARERVVGDAPARPRQIAQPNTCFLTVTRHNTHQPPLAAAKAHSYLPNNGLPGIEPEQPNAPKTTTSATGRAVPPRCCSCPATSSLPLNNRELQQCGVTGAISSPFPISQALAHQHHRQPRRPAGRPAARRSASKSYLFCVYV